MNAVDMPAYGDSLALALKTLGVVVLIDLCREAFALARGQQADFVGVATRAAIAASVLSAIPWLSTTLAWAVMAFFDGVLGTAESDLLNRTFKQAFENFDCDVPDSPWGFLSVLFSASGLLMILAQGVVYLTVLVKWVVIDVLWTVMLALVVYMGVVTMPITFLREMGGLKVYARNVAKVAMWPPVFAVFASLIAAFFPKTLEAVASGEISVECQSALTYIEGGARSAASAASTGVTDKATGLLNFLAICVTLVWLTARTPSVSDSLFGAGGAGGTGGGIISQLRQTARSSSRRRSSQRTTTSRSQKPKPPPGQSGRVG